MMSLGCTISNRIEKLVIEYGLPKCKALYCQKDYQCKKGYVCHSNTSLYTQRQVNEYMVLQEQSS